MNTVKKENYITEGIIIAAFTLLSYVMAYEYETGFCSYWGIPRFFIDISLTAVVSAGLSIFFFVLWLLIIMNVPIMFFDKALSKEDSLQKRFIVSHLIFLAVLIASLRGYGISFIPIFLAGSVIVLDLFCFILPWWIDKKKNPGSASFFERLSRSFQDQREPKNIYDWLMSIAGAKPVYIFIIILPLLTLVASAAGSASAKNATQFMLVESENLILIKKYGENYFLRPIDSSSNKVASEIIVWNGENIAKYKLTPKQIKNIKIAKD